MSQDMTVCGYGIIMAGQTIECQLLRIPHGQTRKFSFQHGSKTLARFDTEEKGRLYADAYIAGLEAGYTIQREEKRP